MIECNQEVRKEACACTYDCERRGKCCECLEHHLSKNQLHGCVFVKISKEAEKSYNGDIEYFAKLSLSR